MPGKRKSQFQGSVSGLRKNERELLHEMHESADARMYHAANSAVFEATSAREHVNQNERAEAHRDIGLVIDNTLEVDMLATKKAVKKAAEKVLNDAEVAETQTAHGNNKTAMSAAVSKTVRDSREMLYDVVHEETKVHAGVGKKRSAKRKAVHAKADSPTKKKRSTHWTAHVKAWMHSHPGVPLPEASKLAAATYKKQQRKD